MKARSTLAEMCLAIGIPILMHKDFSTRVCKPCERKIRNANECYTFIPSNLADASPKNVTPKTSPTTSPVRNKRVLPTTVTTPERNPRPTKKKSSTPAVKSLNYESICEESRNEGIEYLNNDCVLSALNIEELYNSEKETTQLKTAVVSSNGNVETRLSFDESLKKIIINLVRGNLKTVANMLFKLPNIEEYLRGAFTRTVACEFKQYCGDNAESMLKATTPHDIYSCIFKQRPSP